MPSIERMSLAGHSEFQRVDLLRQLEEANERMARCWSADSELGILARKCVLAVRRLRAMLTEPDRRALLLNRIGPWDGVNHEAALLIEFLKEL